MDYVEIINVDGVYVDVDKRVLKLASAVIIEKLSFISFLSGAGHNIYVELIKLFLHIIICFNYLDIVIFY